MTGRKHLTKDEELSFGELVQKAESVYKKHKTRELDDLPKDSIKDVLAGEEAARRLFEANEGLVYDRVIKFKKRYPSAPPNEDLLQEGRIGLLAAIRKYDPKRNNKLSTVATYWIFQAISRYSNGNSRMVRLPENKSADLIKGNRIRRELESQGIDPSKIEEMVRLETGLSKSDYSAVINASGGHVSLNYKIDPNSGIELIDLLNPEDTTTPEDVTIGESSWKDMLSAIEGLSEKDRDVLKSFFSLEGGMPPKVARAKYSMKMRDFGEAAENAVTQVRAALEERGVSYQDLTLLS